jgi:hypothetical protein
MRKNSMRNGIQQKYLLDLGKRIETLIILGGYHSVYDFWIQKCDESGLARSTLNYIVAGQTDPKITTLKMIADCLEISMNQLLG